MRFCLTQQELIDAIGPGEGVQLVRDQSNERLKAWLSACGFFNVVNSSVTVVQNKAHKRWEYEVCFHSSGWTGKSDE